MLIVRIHVVRGLIFSGAVRFHSPLPLLYYKLTYTGRGLDMYFHGFCSGCSGRVRTEKGCFPPDLVDFHMECGFCSGFFVLPEQELFGMNRAKSRIKPSLY